MSRETWLHSGGTHVIFTGGLEIICDHDFFIFYLAAKHFRFVEKCVIHILERAICLEMFQVAQFTDIVLDICNYNT